MLGKLIVAAALAVSLVPSAVQAQPKRWTFDATGWTLLGKQSVDGRTDKDVINVSAYTGKLDELSIVVEDSDLDLKDFTVVFDNGERWSPKLAHTFKEGARSRAIDLPGSNRIIKKIELLYSNKRGGGKASLAVYGRDKRGGGRPDRSPPPATGWKFDATGWTLLGSQGVDGRRDKDVIRVGNYKGAFDQLTLVVVDSDIELKDFTVVFNNNTKWSPRLQHTFKEGARSRVIDLPGKDRRIARIELAYANLPGGGKAKVEVYGRDIGRPAPPPIAKINWENKGWKQIGKVTVDGWRDRDKLMAGNAQYTELMFVAAGSDLELHDVVVTFGNNEKYSPPTRLTFKEGTRTAPIDLPGARRRLRSIEFAFSNLPGGGRAQLEVWGRIKDAGGDAPKKPY
jgi:hypothetical protein